MTPHPVAAQGNPAAPSLRTHDLTVGYKTRRVRHAVLEHVTLDARSGELICLLGPNGIGKSTLLRTLARMQPALGGTVALDGTDVRSLTHRELARRLGVVLTERVLVEAMPVRGVVELGRHAHSGWLGRLAREDRDAVARAIQAVGAGHLADRDFSRLSDGERQRVMIARALAQEPVLLILDEPTAFLDVPSRVELMGLLRRLTREASLAVVVSTHDLELALRTADLIWLVMPDGVIRTGAPEDIILSGALTQAFESRQVRFYPEERTFRLVADRRGEAEVRGQGLRAALATAVVEREGYAVIAGPSAAALSVEVDESGWSAGGKVRGLDFASLATFIRNRSEVR